MIMNDRGNCNKTMNEYLYFDRQYSIYAFSTHPFHVKEGSQLDRRSTTAVHSVTTRAGSQNRIFNSTQALKQCP